VNIIWAAPFTILPQNLMDLPVAIDTTRLQPERLDHPCELIIYVLAHRHGLMTPGVIAAGMDVQQVAQPADRL